MKLRDALTRDGRFGASTHLVLPLHSMLPSQDQRKVFQRPPKGVRKIVLSTNIAETAVTIDDVVCVLDGGRHKEKSFDAYTGVATLQATWVPAASARQRRGRAGRTRPGVCFHLYTRQRFEALEDFAVPEIR